MNNMHLFLLSLKNESTPVKGAVKGTAAFCPSTVTCAHSLFNARLGPMLFLNPAPSYSMLYVDFRTSIITNL